MSVNFDVDWPDMLELPSDEDEALANLDLSNIELQLVGNATASSLPSYDETERRWTSRTQQYQFLVLLDQKDSKHWMKMNFKK